MSYDSCVNPWHYNFVTLFAGYVPWTLLALLSLFSLTYHKFSILGFSSIQSNSESQSKEFIFQRQNIVSEADFLHLYNNDGLGYEKLQAPTTFF
jgi:hypothetical protein